MSTEWMQPNACEANEDTPRSDDLSEADLSQAAGDLVAKMTVAITLVREAAEALERARAIAVTGHWAAMAVLSGMARRQLETIAARLDRGPEDLSSAQSDVSL